MFFMLSIAIKNLLCFLLYVGSEKKFRSTKFLCDNKKFRLANNIDAYAITLFLLGVAIEKQKEAEAVKSNEKFFERCILYCETFPVFKFLFLPFFYSKMAANTVEARKNIKFMCFIILCHLSLSHSLSVVLAKEIYLFYSYIFQRAVKMS